MTEKELEPVAQILAVLMEEADPDARMTILARACRAFVDCRDFNERFGAVA